MTTIAQLFADARLGIVGLSARTDRFTDLDITGESYHGSLFVGRHMRRRLRIWNCIISARHNTGGISFIYSVQGADANEALGKVERKVLEHAAMKIGMRL